MLSLGENIAKKVSGGYFFDSHCRLQNYDTESMMAEFRTHNSVYVMIHFIQMNLLV